MEGRPAIETGTCTAGDGKPNEKSGSQQHSFKSVFAFQLYLLHIVAMPDVRFQYFFFCSYSVTVIHLGPSVGRFGKLSGQRHVAGGHDGGDQWSDGTISAA